MLSTVSIVNASDLVQDLLVAAADGDVERVQHLLAAGADVNSRNINSTTALMYASSSGHVGVVDLLLDSGADVNQSRPDGIAALFLAAQEGHAEVVERLIDHGAKIEQPHTSGATPLYLAAQGGQIQIAKLLISKGADVNVRISTGFTPLIVASGHGHLETVTLLLQNGAKNFATATGLTALSRAISEGRDDVAELLMLNNEGAALDPTSIEGANFTQRSLNNLGCDAGAVDGLPGDQTRRALRDFEDWVGLKPTGKITREVLALLYDTNSAVKAEPRIQEYAVPGDTFNVCVSQSKEACRAKFETIDAYSACPVDTAALRQKLCVSSIACGKVSILGMSMKLVDGVQSTLCTPALWQITCGTLDESRIEKPRITETQGLSRDEYIKRVARKISNSFHYPIHARRNNQEGRVVVKFTIGKGGEVLTAELIDKSGFSVIDQDALETVKRASPFGRLPEDISEDRLRLKLPIIYKLQ